MTRRSYTVKKDDTPYKIAQMMGAFSRPKWWAELRAANPSKTVTNGNWTSLYPNEEIGIPDAWPEHPLAKPCNPATPTIPGFPGPVQNSTMDVGVVANTQILVAAWARRHGACDPLDFGLQPSDFSGLVDARTQRALVSFQLWWNKWNPARTLRTRASRVRPRPSRILSSQLICSTRPAPIPDGTGWNGSELDP